MIETYTPHRFNPTVAEVYGVNAALIFEYVSFRSRTAPARWVDLTLDDICKQYPYLGAWQVWAALQKLISAGRKTPPLILRKQVDGAYLYAPVCEQSSKEALHVFDARVALQVGVIPAIILHNVGYWIKENWRTAAEELYQRLDPEEFDSSDFQMQRFAYQMTRKVAAHHSRVEDWVKHHRYVSQRTAERGFSCLLQEGSLKVTHVRRRKPLWHLSRKWLCEFEREMLSKSDLCEFTAKTQNVAPKPKVCRQNPKRAAKTQADLTLTSMGSTSSGAVEEAFIEETGLRLEKPVEDHNDPFEPPALANARTGQPEGRRERSTSFRSSRELRQNNVPNLPEVKAKILRDGLGHPVKRQVVHKPTPDDPDWLEYLEELTPEERNSYIASFR